MSNTLPLNFSGVVPSLAQVADFGPPRSEIGIGCLMAWLGKLYVLNYVSHRARSGSGEVWPRDNFGRTRILHDWKVGVIGFGLIGQGIASLVQHFTDKVLIHSEHAFPEALESQGFRKASRAEIFSSCEVIVLSGAYTPKTHHMVRMGEYCRETLIPNLDKVAHLHFAEPPERGILREKGGLALERMIPFDTAGRI